MTGSVAEERIENEGALGTLGGGLRRIASVGRIEHARFGGPLGVGIGLYRGVRLRLCVRRKIEPGFAPAAAERQRGCAQQDEGPSLICRAVVAVHDKIPNAAAPYKDWPVLARPAAN